jgi:hypothetical protein
MLQVLVRDAYKVPIKTWFFVKNLTASTGDKRTSVALVILPDRQPIENTSVCFPV